MSDYRLPYIADGDLHPLPINDVAAVDRLIENRVAPEDRLSIRQALAIPTGVR